VYGTTCLRPASPGQDRLLRRPPELTLRGSTVWALDAEHQRDAARPSPSHTARLRRRPSWNARVITTCPISAVAGVVGARRCLGTALSLGRRHVAAGFASTRLRRDSNVVSAFSGGRRSCGVAGGCRRPAWEWPWTRGTPAAGRSAAPSASWSSPGNASALGSGTTRAVRRTGRPILHLPRGVAARRLDRSHPRLTVVVHWRIPTHSEIAPPASGWAAQHLPTRGRVSSNEIAEALGSGSSSRRGNTGCRCSWCSTPESNIDDALPVRIPAAIREGALRPATSPTRSSPCRPSRTRRTGKKRRDPLSSDPAEVDPRARSMARVAVTTRTPFDGSRLPRQGVDPVKISVLIPTRRDRHPARAHAAISDQLRYDFGHCSHIAPAIRSPQPPSADWHTSPLRQPWPTAWPRSITAPPPPRWPRLPPRSDDLSRRPLPPSRPRHRSPVHHGGLARAGSSGTRWPEMARVGTRNTAPMCA